MEEPVIYDENQIDDNRVIKDLIAGTCGGVAQVLSGQPFDTTKVRLQSAPEGRYSGAMDVVKQIMKNEGFKGFYKGTLTPLIGVGACVSIQFSVNEYMKRMFGAQNISLGLKDTRLSSWQFYQCGAAAGFANGFLASPIEQIRIRLQVQTADNKLFHGPIDCIKKMYGAGGIQGIYRGIMPTLVRESHGMGMYFLTFEALVKREMALKDCQRKDIPGWKLCMYGAGAGYGMWTTAYPIDVIKSKMQTDSIFPAERKYKNSFDCAKQIMREQGVKGFFRGFGPTMLRAAPVNACTFYAFELACRAMG